MTATLDDLITRVRKLPAAFREARVRAIKAADDAMRAEVRAGHGADGADWAWRKDGGLPLVKAADAITLRVVPDGAVWSLDYVHHFHQEGTKRGLPARPILPTSNDLPQPMADAMIREFEKALKP